MNENGLEILSGAFYLDIFRSLIHIHAQDILPEQIFSPLPDGDFLAFLGCSIPASNQKTSEMNALHQNPREQGAGQEPLRLVQLILVDSSACSDREATQAAV